MSKTRFLLIAGSMLVATPAAQAQIGSGWTRKTYTKKIHLDNESLFQIFGSTSGATLRTPAVTVRRRQVRLYSK